MSWLDRFRRPRTGTDRGGSEKPAAPVRPEGQSPSTLPKPPAGGTVVRPAAPQPSPVPSAVVPPRPTPRLTLRKGLTLPTFAVDARIDDTYVVKRVIQAGAQGNIYVAHHERWDLDLVLKTPKPEDLGNEDALRRLVREAEAWTALGLHPHIAYCYYVHPLDGVPLLVIEYLDGGNLGDWIAEGRCADLKVALDLAIQACHALEHAHTRGMIHRDVKPANILMASDGTLKVTDFGLVRVGAPEAPPSDSSAPVEFAAARTTPGVGTHEYMPPEQFADTHTVDARADLFALGVCLYEMLCGRRPYALATGPRQLPLDPRTLRGDSTLPSRLVTLLKSCVDWDPARRPASAKALRQELCTIYQDCYGAPSPFAETPEVPLEADGWNNRGVTHLELHQPDEARKCFTEALEAMPTHFEATCNLALLEWQQGAIDDLEVLRRLDRLTPAAPPAALALARAEVHLARGDRAAADAALAAHPDGTAALPIDSEVPDRRLVRTLEEHKWPVVDVAFTQDGRCALSGDSFATFNFWDLMEGACIHTLTGPERLLDSVAFTPDGRWGLSGSGDKTLQLWDLTQGTCVRTLITGHTSPVTSVAFTPDGRWGLSGSKDKTIRVWDLVQGICVSTLEGHKHWVNSVGITPDGRWALSGSNDKTLKLWDLTLSTCIFTLEGHTSYVAAVALTPDGRWALSGGGDKTIKVWDLMQGICVRTLKGHFRESGAVALTPDGQWALSGSKDETLKVWDVMQGICVRTLEGHMHDVNSVALTPDGRSALSGSTDKTVKLWSVDVTRRYLPAFKLCRPRQFDAVRAAHVDLSRDLARVRAAQLAGNYAGAYQAIAAVWRREGVRLDRGVEDLYRALLARGTPTTILAVVKRFSAGEETNCVALTADGRWGLSDNNNRLKLWDLAQGICSRVLEGHSLGITSVAVTPDGRWAVSGSSDTTLKLWDLAQGTCERTLEGHKRAVRSVALTPDCRWGLSGSDDMTLKLWDLAQGTCERTLNVHVSSVNSIALTPDGRRALSGSNDWSLRAWDLGRGACVWTQGEPFSRITSVALTPDGRWALSGSNDCTVKLWDFTQGTHGHTIGVGSWVRGLAVTPDASGVLVADQDGLAMWCVFWNLEFPNG